MMGVKALDVLFMPVGLGGLGIGKSPFEKKKESEPQASQPLPMPSAPSPQDEATKAQETVRKRRVASTQTIYTDPLGISGQASVARKTLTGQ